MCEKPVDQHCKVKAIPGTLFLSAFEANSRGVSGHLLLELMGNGGNWRTLLMDALTCMFLLPFHFIKICQVNNNNNNSNNNNLYLVQRGLVDC